MGIQIRRSGRQLHGFHPRGLGHTGERSSISSAVPYPEKHQFAICREPRWWHHAPRVPEVLPGCAQVNKTAIRIPLFTADAGDLIDQYARAFEKVRAHGTKLAKA